MARKKTKQRSKRAAKSSVTPTPATEHPLVSDKQRKLPAGFRRDGTGMLSLEDLLAAPELDTKSLDDLNESEQADLTAERIRAQDKYSISIVGVGRLDKERAISEVKNHTPTGRTLVDIEKRTMRMVIQAARAAAQKHPV